MPLLLLLLHLASAAGGVAVSCSEGASPGDDPFSILNYHDYSPPSSAPPQPPPPPPPLTCHSLNGTGSLSTACTLSASITLSSSASISGAGILTLLPFTALSCTVPDCLLYFNISSLRLRNSSSITASSIYVYSSNVVLLSEASLNVSARGGSPPPGSSGVPTGLTGDGGGYGGRGASCAVRDGQIEEDVWGGDVYAWNMLMWPWCHGSRGGTTSREVEYGGEGGGRVRVEVEGEFLVEGVVSADGGNGGELGGGGAGGSVYLKAKTMKGSGNVSACGGIGLAGGGGGRISVDVFSRQSDPKIFVHGGRSIACIKNAGAAGTFYDTVTQSLYINNHNYTTQTDTIFYDFPNQPLWAKIFVRNCAKVRVPLLWSRVQVQGPITLASGGVLSFGLTRYPCSEFELIAQELLMSDSVIKVSGALRMSVKVLLMWNSRMLINGSGGDAFMATSLLEASTYIILRESSVIRSDANLGVHGQGLLNLSGPGDMIEAQRLVLALFYSIQVGTGAILRGPLINGTSDDMAPRLNCEHQDCPMELIHPPEDCNVNASLSFTLQICRVEDINVAGLIQGTVVHFHRARSVVVHPTGTISASGLGCKGGVGRGTIVSNSTGSGGGHGGKGGDGFYNGVFVRGGVTYGNPSLPCELGSGSGNDSMPTSTAGGGIIVMGSLEHSLSSVSVYGTVVADGESSGGSGVIDDAVTRSLGRGSGGGSGGTILLFLSTLALGDRSVLSSIGGFGGANGGGGGGGRIHFHWSDIPSGDEYFPVASVKGNIHTRGGMGTGQGYAGDNGTITGKACPKGLYGTFCQECPLGTFKNVTGSDASLCYQCPINQLPRRAQYTSIRGGVADMPCPYKCVSERYHMPHCYTALEELIYTFGGPWLFGLLLFGLLVLLALVLSVARMKFVGNDELPGPAPTQHGAQIDHSFPFLESLNEVLETNRAEESQSHMHRMYFMGPNKFSEPWHLPISPPEQITEIVYEDAFNRFVDEINNLAAYQWWEGSIYTISCVLAYPLAWSWQQWRRKKKLQQLREFVRSEYDHSCLRSCRSRALYEGLKVSATPDLMLAYVDFYLGGDEKRSDLPPHLHQQFPMCLIFGGDGSYMTPFSLHSDNVLTTVMGQSIAPTIWYRLVAGLNVQLRLVRRGNFNTTFLPVLSWLKTHANPALSRYGVRVDLAWFQATSFGYCQLGLVVYAAEVNEATTVNSVTSTAKLPESLRVYSGHRDNLPDYTKSTETLSLHKRINGGILDSYNLQKLEDRKGIFFLFSLLVHNSKPVGHQDLVGLVISILLLGDFSLVLLTLLQLYSFSMADVFLVLLILPLGILSPFPAGVSALFSHGPSRSAGLARVYALWNMSSLVNVAVAFICGLLHYKFSPSRKHGNLQPWNLGADESGWWLFPAGLVLCKCIQARLVDLHVANLEIQDRSLYSNDPRIFWQS